jgi:hypothetical protein
MSDDLDGMTVLDFTTDGDGFQLRDQAGEVVHEHHAAETSTQRPWAAVARFPEPFEPKAAVAHFAAMAYAHHLAYGAGIVTARDRETVLDLTYRHFFPMAAAFTAAASMDESGEWTSSLVRDAIADGAGVPETCWQWLTAAGIDPAEIAAAS